MVRSKIKLNEKKKFKYLYLFTVQVVCTHEEMSIRYNPKDWFQGKMYVSMHSKDCMVQGNGTKSTVLKLKIGNEAKENKCGILRAYEVTKEYKRFGINILIS